MIVLIHGLGDTPENLGRLFDGFTARARIELLRAPDQYGSGFSWFPIESNDGSVVVRADDVARASERVAKKIEELAQTRPTRGKPIVTGFSQGGMIAFQLAVNHPETIARAIPISGWLPLELIPEDAKVKEAAPIVAFHGEDDLLVAFGPTRDLAKQLKEAGANITFVPVPKAEHNITAEMRALILTELARGL